jgi:hypothetical protein
LANELRTDLFKVLINRGCGVKFVISDNGNKNLFDKTRGRELDIRRLGFGEFNKRIFDTRDEFKIIFSKFVLEYAWLAL